MPSPQSSSELAVLARPALEVAPDLLGWHLVHDAPEGRVAIRLTETEAYEGADDPASHAYRGPTPRTQVMFERPGLLYVYRSYGAHWACNVVTGAAGLASAVLLRAGAVVEGTALAQRRRGLSRDLPDSVSRLARGPGNLASALGLTGDHYGLDLLDAASPVRLQRGRRPDVVRTGPRVGISRAADRPWRFWSADDLTVSAYRRSPRAPAP
ncbi:DNA-3-methyladenine glycosylase [Ornithinimicrobium sp. Y1694]|uniref:DNA-3-methyladenine glycosylase n=1 Tax=Ornithinimicrobium sp. Y1694 TaxID=3418590 RepID=UPI003CF19209